MLLGEDVNSWSNLGRGALSPGLWSQEEVLLEVRASRTVTWEGPLLKEGPEPVSKKCMLPDGGYIQKWRRKMFTRVEPSLLNSVLEI